MSHQLLEATTPDSQGACIRDRSPSKDKYVLAGRVGVQGERGVESTSMRLGAWRDYSKEGGTATCTPSLLNKEVRRA
jgi:hypothetical protein